MGSWAGNVLAVCSYGLNSGTLWPQLAYWESRTSALKQVSLGGISRVDCWAGTRVGYVEILRRCCFTLVTQFSYTLFYPCFPNYRLISNLLMKQVLQDLPHVEGEENRLWAMELHMMDLWLLGCGSFVMWTILTFQIKRFKQFKSFLLQLALILLRDLGIWYSDRSLPWLSRLISIFKPDR